MRPIGGGVFVVYEGEEKEKKPKLRKERSARSNETELE